MIQTEERTRTASVKVKGGAKLIGKVAVQGSKNAVLPIISAAVLHDGKTLLRNVPDIADVHSLLDILDTLGVVFTFEKGVLELDSTNVKNKVITDELSSKLRASSLLLGPLLARFGSCAVGMPGGCSIGPRPLNYHFDGFEHFNANVIVESGIVRASTKEIKGEYMLPFPSVGATQNLISAGVFNKGEVTLKNIALEPEVMAMIDFLNNAGADIKIVGGNTLVIKGVDKLKNSEFTIPYDRIEAATLLAAGAATKGDITLIDINPDHISNILTKFEDMGLQVTTTDNSVRLKYVGILKGTQIKTGVHPAFPTDAQAQFSVVMTKADSMSMITETIFNNRFHHLEEMIKMSADIHIENNMAVINPSNLSGCNVSGYELRGTASMIIAGLIAKGDTRVSNLKYMYRGYEAFVEKLNYLGAEIKYI